MCLYVQHGAAVVQDKLYVYGGNHNGRYLNDLHVSIVQYLCCRKLCILSNFNISCDVD